MKDLTWFEPNGQEMTDDAWNAHFVRALMVRLAGDAIDETDMDGNHITDDTFVLILNAHEDTVTFSLPPAGGNGSRRWHRILDTGVGDWRRVFPLRGHRYRLGGRSMAIFQLKPNEAARRTSGGRAAGAPS